MPIEVCMTINDNWGFHAMDDDHKSTQRLLNNLIRSASMNANYLLNVGPTAEGVILPVHVARLRGRVHGWMSTARPSMACVASSPRPAASPPARATRTMCNGARAMTAHCIYLEGLPESVQQASLLSDGSALELKSARKGRYVTVPAEKRYALVTVVKLQ